MIQFIKIINNWGLTYAVEQVSLAERYKKEAQKIYMLLVPFYQKTSLQSFSQIINLHHLV